MGRKRKKRLCRNPVRGILAGVCAGLSDYTGIPAWVFRIIFLIPGFPLVPISGWISLFIYIALIFVMPDYRKVKQPDDSVVEEVEYEIIDDEETDK